MEDPIPTRRDRQAEQTRREILAAARGLFAEQGYARTTVKQIAAAAGVTPQTVYDSVGVKRALVVALNDLIDDEAGIGPIAAGAAVETDPVRLVATCARVTRALVEACGDIITAVVSGAATEAELATVLDQGRRRHRGGAERIVARLAELGALRGDLGRDDATATLAALTEVEYALLLQAHGWPVEAIEAWMTDTCCRVLLA